MPELRTQAVVPH